MVFVGRARLLLLVRRGVMQRCAGVNAAGLCVP
jgi:hypothetical protein